MKAIINKNFYNLFFYAYEVENNCVEIDEECLCEFNAGDEVEILRVLPVGAYAENQKAYIVLNPKNNESITIAECFLEIEEG